MNEPLRINLSLMPKGESALVGVSGGVDSMVLLRVLAQHANIQIAHLNHQLRGKASDADERLVLQTAKELGIPCHVEQADVKTLAREQKVSIEMAARKCRHEFLTRLARKLGITRIALAHHADDQVELFFLRLLRGAGPEGLAGMRETAPSPVDPALTIVRPLLQATKDEIRTYAAEHKIPFREDTTNASTSILRNRIRHKLIPLLTRDYQPGLVQVILRAMDLLAAESDLIARESERCLDPFDGLHVALQRRRLRQQVYEAGIDANFDLVEMLRLRPTVPVQIGAKLVSRDRAGAVRVSDFASWKGDNLSISVADTGTVEFGGLVIRWSNGSRARATRNLECFDADKVGAIVTLRHWQPGDRFQPIGMKQPVKLQDLFTNAKVPRNARHQRIVATTADNEIFWVEGLRISDAFKVEPATRVFLQWRWDRR